MHSSVSNRSQIEQPQTQWTQALLVAVSFVLTACGGGGGDAPQSAPSAPATAAASTSRPVAQSDFEIAQLLYADNQRTPANFYNDAAPSGLGVVATTHLKNGDIATGTTSSHELCTDDWTEALAWSDTAAAAAGNLGSVVGTNTTARYFEFSRMRNTTPTVYVRSRVYRCSYLDRTAVNLADTAIVRSAGRMAQAQVSAAELQTLSEYLWQFTTYNNAGNVVLQSSGAPAPQGFSHTLHIATMTRAGSGQTCDQIEVATWTHSVDSTGALQLRIEESFSYGVRRVSGIVEYCSI